MSRPTAARVIQRGQRLPTTVTEFKCGSRIVMSVCEINGLGHAWSGDTAGQPYSDPRGPDALRMIWAFAMRQFQAHACSP